MSTFDLDKVISNYEKIFYCPKLPNIFTRIFSKPEILPLLCPLCRNEIKEEKERIMHNKKCVKLHLIWFARYEILRRIHTLKSCSKSVDKKSIESYNTQLLKVDAIIGKENLKWKLKFNKSVADSLDIKLENFEFIKPLTKGGYGQIFLTRDKLTGLEMITKIISISEAIQRSCVNSYVNERELLIRCKSDYIVSIFYSFLSEFFIFQVMEFMPEGDLSSHLEILGHFDEETVRIILAQLLLALKELREKEIVHGDIKLENVLYSVKEGVVKLADFGLAFDINAPNKSSVLGTPEYMAPEIILESKKGFESDIWAIGICAYEMLFGVPPFYDESPEKIFEKIFESEKSITLQLTDISDSAKDLIGKLLFFDYRNRISMEEAMKHEFFANIDWSKPPKIKLTEFNSIFEERNKRYESIQFYNKETISSEIVTYEHGIFNQKASLENQMDLLKLFPIKNLNKLKN